MGCIALHPDDRFAFAFFPSIALKMRHRYVPVQAELRHDHVRGMMPPLAPASLTLASSPRSQQVVTLHETDLQRSRPARHGIRGRRHAPAHGRLRHRRGVAHGRGRAHQQGGRAGSGHRRGEHPAQALVCPLRLAPSRGCAMPAGPASVSCRAATSFSMGKGELNPRHWLCARAFQEGRHFLQPLAAYQLLRAARHGLFRQDGHADGRCSSWVSASCRPKPSSCVIYNPFCGSTCRATPRRATQLSFYIRSIR
jgi:hypothetical protein